MIRFGGDYNPEQWPSPVWAEDVGLMLRAGVNLVTVGVFSWSRLQPGPDEFDFGWLDRVLDLLGSAGIGVCLATPTASPPPWFTRLHPTAMPINHDGVRLSHGSRDTYCVNAPAYQSASLEITGRLASRYAGHDALRLWHVHNEYGTTCYCDHCAAAFRRWLAARYGDPATLNDAWSTDFWSQRVSNFDEVLPPRATQYLSNPAQLLDYRRFVSDAMLEHYRSQRALLSGAPVTTNFVLGGWVPVDHARWAREVDIVAIDDYPTTLAERAFAADLARGWARGGPWMLMEHAPSVEAREIAQPYLDRGATGILYFQWRASRGGAEQWHPAMVPHEGPDTPVFREISALGATLRDREPVAVTATSALIYDEQTMWALQSPHLPPRAEGYEATVKRWHRAFDGPVDVVPPDASLGEYDLVVAPLLYLLPAAGHRALRDYVSGGGRLVLTFDSGLVDEHCRVTPGALDDLIGARRIQHDLEPATATVLRHTPDGRPAVLENHYGGGVVRYVATDLDDLGLTLLEI
ncbi:beta-galactosidase [Actinoplanes sp. NPDC026619]|uniref:beta-galactosidase n=1 Tax=Actinoplanes sp. NPDC026619 TaxID=3155798 RepID=UPI0033F2860A